MPRTSSLSAAAERLWALVRSLPLTITAVTSITAVGRQHQFQSLAATGRAARTVDEVQFLLREGPCVTAAAKEESMDTSSPARDVGRRL